MLRHTDGTYSIRVAIENNAASLDNTWDEQALRTAQANSMVRRLFAEAEAYYSIYPTRVVNYEDLFYLATQAFDEESGEGENPAIQGFAQELREFSSQLDRLQPFLSFRDRLDETKNYIADVLWHCLLGRATNANHLKCFATACEEGRVVSIATLCHDTHVERHFRNEGFLLADGFADQDGDVRYWTGDFSSSEAIPFLKLHGSVNWFRLIRDFGSRFDEKIGVVDGDFQHTKSKEGELQDALDGRPMLLVGSFNKVSEYSRGMFRELHYQFRHSIRAADKVVICGYSFGDKGINGELINWYYSGRGREFVVIHPNPEELVGEARAAIRDKWESWKNESAITCIRSKIECIEADEFFACL